MIQMRKRLSSPEKVAVLRQYVVQRVPISDLCDEYGLQISQAVSFEQAIREVSCEPSFAVAAWQPPGTPLGPGRFTPPDEPLPAPH